MADLSFFPTMQFSRGFSIPVSTASTNAHVIKDSEGRVSTISGFNNSTSPRHLKLYDMAVTPNVGVDAPVWTEVLPPQEKFNVFLDAVPLMFLNGIAIAFTISPQPSDSSPIDAGDITGLNLSYI